MGIEITIEQHNQNIDPVRNIAMMLPLDSLSLPRIPHPIYSHEGHVALMAAKEHLDALTACGMPPELLDTLAAYLDAFDSSQALWQLERRKGRNEETIKLISDAEKLRSDALAACDLAFRKNIEGQRRLAVIREGEGLKDLVCDCRELGLLLTDGRAALEAINYDVDDVATRLCTFAENIQDSLAEEDVAKSLSGQKELRDRIMALVHDTLGEIRAFAKFAFRNDSRNNRRAPFFSAYTRKTNRRYMRNKSLVIDIDTE